MARRQSVVTTRPQESHHHDAETHELVTYSDHSDHSDQQEAVAVDPPAKATSFKSPEGFFFAMGTLGGILATLIVVLTVPGIFFAPEKPDHSPGVPHLLSKEAPASSTIQWRKLTSSTKVHLATHPKRSHPMRHSN